MMISYRFKLALIFLTMFIICLNMTREHWQNFNNNVNAGIDPSYSSLSDKNYYDSFYIYMSHEIDSFLKQEKKWSREVLKDEIHLEQREKTRWVFNTLIVKAFITIKEISLRQDIFPKEKISLYLYSIFIGFFIFLIYVFSYLYLNLLNKMNNRSDYSDRLGLSIFLFFSYFLTISYLNFVHYRGGEDNFSIFETLCIISALYLITLNKKWSILIYIVVCCLAPLVRESGIFISLYYLCYRFIFFKEIKILGFLVPILSTLPYILSNYDLFYFYFQEGFIYSTKNIEEQFGKDELTGNPEQLKLLFD